MSQTQFLHQQIAQLPALEQIALAEEILHRLDTPDSWPCQLGTAATSAMDMLSFE